MTWTDHRHRRLVLFLAPVALAAVLLPACFSSEPTPMEPIDDGGGLTASVEMTNALAFDPSPATIRVGGTVVVNP